MAGAGIPPAPPLPPPPQRPSARGGTAGGAGITAQTLQAARAALRPAEDGYPLPAFRFVVAFDAKPGRTLDSAFHEVSGIGPEVETETVHEGGLNGYAHVLPKAVKHPRLVLRRGIAASGSRLVRWCQDVLEGGFVRPIEARLLHVYLLDHVGAAVRGWAVENAWPVKWEIDGFHAMRNQVAMEKVELAYARSTRIV